MKLFTIWLLLQLQTQETEKSQCGLNQPSIDLAELIINHPSQKRSELVCNELLAEIAGNRAESMVNQSADSELTANQFVIKQGFRFASYYPVTGNQVEAIAKDVNSPEAALNYLINSNKHHNHVLGKGDFFVRQNQIGVGFYHSDLGQKQYVVMIAEPYKNPKIVFKPAELKPPTVRTVTDCPRDWRRSPNAELRKVCREMAQSEREQINKK